MDCDLAVFAIFTVRAEPNKDRERETELGSGVSTESGEHVSKLVGRYDGGISEGAPKITHGTLEGFYSHSTRPIEPHSEVSQ